MTPEAAGRHLSTRGAAKPREENNDGGARIMGHVATNNKGLGLRVRRCEGGTNWFQNQSIVDSTDNAGDSGRLALP